LALRKLKDRNKFVQESRTVTQDQRWTKHNIVSCQVRSVIMICELNWKCLYSKIKQNTHERQKLKITEIFYFPMKFSNKIRTGQFNIFSTTVKKTSQKYVIFDSEIVLCYEEQK
jgi:hypothetical protein